MIVSETLLIISQILRLIKPKNSSPALIAKLRELDDALLSDKEDLEDNDSPVDHQRDWDKRVRRKSKPPDD